MNKYLKFEYWNTCDLGNIYYQGGQHFIFYLDADVGEPIHEEVEEGQENGDGDFIATYRRQMKRYRIRTGLIPDYLIDAIQRMKLHDHIELTFKSGEVEQIYNVDVEPEWQFEKYAWQGTVTLTFDMDESITVGACCDNLTVTDAIPEWYWIATDGSDDTGDGHYTTPWKTLAYACTQVTTPGETIHVKAGTYTETEQSVLAVGVSIVGQGDTTIINSTFNSASTGSIRLASAAGTPVDGNQSISYIKLTGSNLTARIGIIVAYRNNVSIHHITLEDFNHNGIYFYEKHDYWAPLTYPQMTGNSVRYCTITNNGASGIVGVTGGNIRAVATDGLLIEYNTIDQTDRAEGSNGNCIIGVWNKRLKIRYNTMTKLDYNASAFNFFIETWNNMGDYDINDNTFYGLATVAPGGVFNAPAVDCTYGIKIYNNEFLNDANAERTHNAIESTRVAIVIEGNLWEDVYIYNNLIQRYGWGIEISTPTSKSGGTFEEDWVLSNINIYYNIIENVGYTDFNYTHGIIWVNETNNDGYTHETDGLYIYNNVITGMTGTTYSGVQINANGVLDNVAICNNITYNMDSYGVRLEAHASDSLNMTNCDVTYNDFYGSGTSVYVEAAIVQTNFDITTGNITTDPTFVGGGDYHLQAGSPCINAGIDVGLTTDYDGQAVDDPPEIGAYEY